MEFFSPNGSTAPWGPRPPHFSRLHDHTLRHTTLGRTPLDEGPARRRDPLPDNTQHSQETDIHALGGIFFVAHAGNFFFFCLSGVFPLFIHFCTV
jgi:hypothetical protein